MASMQAARFHRYGGPETLVIEPIDRPEPAAGEVLIRIRAASVNPIDWKLRAGMMKDFIPLNLPMTAGQDVAGVIESVGDGVADLHAGDEVYAMLPMQTGGAYAEFVAVPRAAVARKPASLDFTQAAAVPMGALTAWQAVVGAGGLQAGQGLFVHAAAGNVGGMAVQIARALGAHVTAAASAEAREEVTGYGAETFIDYAAGPFEQGVTGMDIVLDTLAGEMQARSWGMLKPGGILVSTLFITDPKAAETHGVRGTGMGAEPNGEQLTRVAAMIDAGQVRPKVATVLPLSEAARAQEMSEAGKTKGKIVLTI